MLVALVTTVIEYAVDEVVGGLISEDSAKLSVVPAGTNVLKKVMKK